MLRTVWIAIILSLLVTGCTRNLWTSTSDKVIPDPQIIKTVVQVDAANVIAPDINKDYIVWSHAQSKPQNPGHRTLREVKLLDLKTNEVQTIYESSFKHGQTDETSISDRWLIWTDWENSNGTDWSIWAYDLHSKRAKKIATTKLKDKPSHLPRPVLDGNRVTWIEEVYSSMNKTSEEVILYDLDSDQLSVISSGIVISNPNKKALIKGNYLVYEALDQATNSQVLFVHDLTNQEFYTLPSEGENYNFHHNGTFLAKLTMENDKEGVSIISLKDKSEIVFIPKKFSELFSFFLSSDSFIWTLNGRIYLNKLSEIDKIIKLTSENESHFWPTVKDNIILWANEKNGWFTGEIVIVQIK